MSIKAHFINIKNEILQNITKAEKSILGAIAWLSDKELMNVLYSKARSGIKIELIISDDQENVKYLELHNNLKSAGIQIYVYNKEIGLMHHKFCIIDNETLIMGSYNWTFTAANYNNESIVIVKNETELINNFREEFNSLKVNLGFITEKIISTTESTINLNTHNKVVELNIANSYLSIAKSNYSDNNYSEVIRNCNLSKNYNSNNFECYLYLAFAKQCQKKYQEALNNYEIALKLNSNSHSIYYNFGLLKKQLKDFTSSETYLKKADQIKPNDINTIIALGDLYYTIDDYYKALNFYNSAFKLKPTNITAELYNKRAKTNYWLNNFKDTIYDFDIAISMGINDAYSFLLRGKAKLELKYYNSSIKDFDKAIELNYVDDLVYIYRGDAKLAIAGFPKLPAINEAIKDYNIFIKLNPKNDYGYCKRAIAFEKCNDIKSAIADYNYAIKLNPNEKVYYNNLGWLYLELEDSFIFRKNIIIARNYFDAAIKIDPYFKSPYIGRSQVKRKLGDDYGSQEDIWKSKNPFR
jgi:tetratricopeptide (TPR) repeat protein